MKKQTVKMAAVAYALAVSLAPASAYAVPGRQPQATESAEAAEAGMESMDGMDGGYSAADVVKSLEGAEGTAGADEDGESSRGTNGAREGGSVDADEGEPGAESAESTADRDRERKSAGSLQEEKAGDLIPPQALPENDAAEDLPGLAEEEEEEKPAYTAPEDTRHANVSFAMTEAVSSAFFSKLTYPVEISLREVDTGSRTTLTVRSAGQILEMEKGDYAVISVKDSGKVPLSVPGDTLHIYENTEYTVRFAANNALKMFIDFLKDNIFLAFFLAFAALFYKKAIIPRFADDIRKR